MLKNTRHGDPYDRGSADAYYQRPYNPHYYVGASYDSEYVSQSNMNEMEVARYKQGWNDQIKSGIYKDY